MNVQILHNGTDITTYVTNYTREQNICTGIGLFDVQIASNCTRTFNPGDTVVLYEAGVKKGTYYCSITAKEETGYFYTLNCQDASKRLSDYFIAKSYLINYPSTSKYWISKFLTEAQVSYTYDVVGSGGLLSNNTSLGMQPCYEQIVQLLQMSGWYMYFDADNTAHIGFLNKEIDDIAEDLERNDILSIKVMKHDQMLRNRAVVWGSGDPITGAWAFANLQTITKWNYGPKDLRAVVVSNSNIPNVATAYTMAKKILNEFARISVEKELEVHGARDVNLGDFVYVNSNVYHGAGLVTSIGSTLSPEGLITNMILDERCPRLFGYFDFGDYVYVSTWGGGVWRKHLQYDATWYNYSTGLVELNVSDLYKNNNLLSCVTELGNAYYSKDFIGSWYQIPGTTDLESVVASGVDGVEYAMYSGVKNRAVVQDWSSNRIRLAADNRPDLNTQDFSVRPNVSTGLYNSFDELGFGGSVRSWVLDYAPGGSMNTFPISVAGEYNLSVYSIANDGSNDFVSVSGPSEITGTQVVDGVQVGGYAECQQLDPTSSRPNYSQFVSSSGWAAEKGYRITTNISLHAEAVATYDEKDFKALVYGYNNNARIAEFTVVSGMVTGLTSHTVALTYQEIFAICRLSSHVYRYLIGYDHTVYMVTVDFTAGSYTTNLTYELPQTVGSYSMQWYTGTRIYPRGPYTNSLGVTNIYLAKEHQNSLPRCSNMYYMVGTGNTGTTPEGCIIMAAKFNLEAGNYDIQTVFEQSGITNLNGSIESYMVLGIDITQNAEALLSRHGDYGPMFKFVLSTDEAEPCPVLGHNGVFRYLSSTATLKIAFGHGFGIATIFGETENADGRDIHYAGTAHHHCTAIGGKTRNTYYSELSMHIFGLDGSAGHAIYSAYPYSFKPYTTLEEASLEYEWRMDTGYYNAGSGIIYQNGAYKLRNHITGEMTTFSFPDWFEPWLVCVHQDEYTNGYYFYGKETNTTYKYEGLMEMDTSGNAVKWNPFAYLSRINPFNSLRDYCYLNGNFVVFERHSHADFQQVHNERWFATEVLYIVHDEIKPTRTGGGLILRRDDTQFAVVYSGGPAKLEISQSYPIVVLASGASSSFILDSFVTTPSGMYNAISLPFVPGGIPQDARYSNFTNSMTSEDFNKKLLVTISGTIKMSDITILAPPLTYTDYHTVASGSADQLEVTNFKLPDQYVFVSSPSVPPNFWQKNPTVSGTSIFSGLAFVDYSSGLPSAHITKIRTDDKI